ncbi:MAG: hypothetical protein WCE46_04765 [Methanoregula sp.]|uniref:hypothetical protein n=1 Tax=Methanoregula sp. TaxID=2052170 RepID=UPI003C757537
MATTVPLSGFADIVLSDEQDPTYFGTEFDSGSSYCVRPSYKKESDLEKDLMIFGERIKFIIDCYQIIYSKMDVIETRLDQIEHQNKEILSLLTAPSVAGSVHLLSNSLVEMSTEKMRTLILEYYTNHKVVYPSDIASEMNLDLEKVVEIINNLISEGKVVETS